MNLGTTQNDFTSGIMDGRMHNRFDYQRYYSSAQEIENALVMPQGGVTKRFGTKFIKNYGASNFNNYRLFTFQYDIDTEYLLVLSPGFVEVFLGNTQIAAIVVPYEANDVENVEGLQVDTRFLFLNKIYPVYSIERGANAPISITGFDDTNDLLTTAVLAGTVDNSIYPAKFTAPTEPELPSAIPKISSKKTYFIKPINATQFKVFESVIEAQRDINNLSIGNAGTSANVVIQNTWVPGNYIFEILPPHDFGTVNYSATTFTPSAVSGNAVTITASAATFTPDYVGGAIIMNGGALIITSVTDATKVQGYTTKPFAAVAAIVGTQVFLGEPAWNPSAGYPSTGAVFQNRLYLASSSAIPNGLWASEVNDYNNFDITTADPDGGFDYAFPSSSIRHLVATRSLLVFTQKEVFTSPIGSELPITPQTINFTGQVGYGCSEITPSSTDNQTFFVDSSNSSLRSTRFSFETGSYIVDDISIIAKSLFRQPVELEKFDGTTFVDGNFIFIINDKYDLVILQTLTRQNILAFTLQKTANLFPSNFYRMTSFINSMYFLVGRANASAPINIGVGAPNVSYNPELASIAVVGGASFAGVAACNFPEANFTPMVGSQPLLPSPKTYYCVNITPGNYIFFETYEDALARRNKINITGLPPTTYIGMTLATSPSESLVLEEMDFTVYTDCTQFYSGVATNSFSVQFANQLYTLSNGKNFVGIEQSSNANLINTGGINYTQLSYGFMFKPKLVPLSINIRTEAGNNFYDQKTITEMYVSYFETFSFTIQGFNNTQQGIDVFINDEVAPPTPSGFETFTPMEGYWRGDNMKIVISQDVPLPWTIRAIDYKIKQD